MQGNAQTEFNAIDETRRILGKWGDSEKATRLGAKGYPCKAPYTDADQVMETCNPDIHKDEEVDRAERALLALKRINHDMFEVLRYTYATTLTGIEIAKRMKCHKRTLQDWRNSGEYYVASRLFN